MSDYTPSIERLRDAYADLGISGNKVSQFEAEFDRAIAKIKADALREAADESERLLAIGQTPNGQVASEQRAEYWAYDDTETPAWLRNRANTLDPS